MNSKQLKELIKECVKETLNENTEVSDEAVVQAMLKYGGSFMKRLAAAFEAADSENRRKIKETWANDWNKYTEFAKRKIN
jgi:hypothetical protein